MIFPNEVAAQYVYQRGQHCFPFLVFVVRNIKKQKYHLVHVSLSFHSALVFKLTISREKDRPK